MTKKVSNGYLYLIEVRPKRPWLHKIGITQNPTFRFESLSESNGKGVKLLRVIYVRKYEEREAWIKDYFSNRQVFYHPLKGNGATEVFRFTMLDLAIITLSMEYWALMEDWRVRSGLWFAGLASFLIAFYLWAPDLFVYTFKKMAYACINLFGLLG